MQLMQIVQLLKNYEGCIEQEVSKERNVAINRLSRNEMLFSKYFFQ